MTYETMTVGKGTMLYKKLHRCLKIAMDHEELKRHVDSIVLQLAKSIDSGETRYKTSVDTWCDQFIERTSRADEERILNAAEISVIMDVLENAILNGSGAQNEVYTPEDWRDYRRACIAFNKISRAGRCGAIRLSEL